MGEGERRPMSGVLLDEACLILIVVVVSGMVGGLGSFSFIDGMERLSLCYPV